MKRKIVFVGGLWSREKDWVINENSLGAVQNAANVLQHSIIRGLDEISGTPVTIMSMLFIGSFPGLYKKPIINTYTFNHSEDIAHTDYNIGFLNLPVVKHYSKAIHVRKFIRSLCKRNDDEELIVIGYSMTYAITKALRYVKKINRNAVTCLIIPDLPEYMSENKKGIANIMKRRSNSVVYKDIKYIDSYVLLTEQMYSRLESARPYVVMEGIAPIKSSNIVRSSDEIKRIVYTGGLSSRYGIKDLIDAFCNIKGDEYRLVLCGSGDAEKYILQKTKYDPRIEFKGNLSNDKAREIQERAYILVNPRKGDDEFTKYSFPSKTMEYMLSGRPVVMYKLEGIPEEYDRHLYYVKESLEKTMIDVLLLSEKELELKGKMAKEFIITEKNARSQVEKIIRMISDI